MSDAKQVYIINAIASGFNDAQIAAGLGTTQSAVTQLIDAHDLRTKAQNKNRFKSIDEKLDNLEEKVLTKLDHALNYQECTPVQLSMILTRLNSARRRSLNEGNTVSPGAQLVQINLPQHMQVNVTMSPQNEVVAIGERIINTMPLNTVQELAKNRKTTPALIHEAIDAGNLFNIPKEVSA